MILKHTEERIIVSINMEYKNSVTFEDGTKIRLERKYDCFDQKYKQPVNATVISAENIPAGSEIIIHHNCTDEVNRILNYNPLSGIDIASDIKYFSISENDAFAWRNEDQWMPLPGFDFAYRVFKPYMGILQGIESTLIKDVLYVYTGEYAGKVCCTLKSCDYQLIFQDVTGREKNIIRFRSAENPKNKRECEVIAIHDEYTKQVLDGRLHVGLTKSDAKPLNELQHVR